MRGIRPGPVPCLWLDVTEALHTEASIRLQWRGPDATGQSVMLVTGWLSCQKVNNIPSIFKIYFILYVDC